MMVGDRLPLRGKADALDAASSEGSDVSGSARAQQAPVLVSACLLGEACRYDGASVPCPEVISLARLRELVPVCPEQLGGLPTPRTPSEIQADGRVVDRDGIDRTGAFGEGAREALRIAREHGCMQAVLKSKSPSCGVRQVYDGTFSGAIVPGCGIAAACLADAGIELFDETDLQSEGPRIPQGDAGAPT